MYNLLEDPFTLPVVNGCPTDFCAGTSKREIGVRARMLTPKLNGFRARRSLRRDVQGLFRPRGQALEGALGAARKNVWDTPSTQPP